MSGHSKWANIKHKKTAQDAKKSKEFSKLSNLIALAAKRGNDPDPRTNPYLRDAIAKAKEINMPQENITRAIKRGLGQIPGLVFEELLLEAYGPEGTAFLIEATTDNRNRTLAEIRKLFNEAGGGLGETGSVLWLFKPIAEIKLTKESWQQSPGLSLEIIDLGADDILENEEITILCHKSKLEPIKEFLEKKQLPHQTELSYRAETILPVTPATQEKLRDLITELEEREDVVAVYTNAQID